MCRHKYLRIPAHTSKQPRTHTNTLVRPCLHTHTRTKIKRTHIQNYHASAMTTGPHLCVCSCACVCARVLIVCLFVLVFVCLCAGKCRAVATTAGRAHSQSRSKFSKVFSLKNVPHNITRELTFEKLRQYLIQPGTYSYSIRLRPLATATATQRPPALCVLSKEPYVYA